MRLSEAQISALRTVQRLSDRGGTYMPFADGVRSFEACERKGLLVYRSVNDGSPYNGYALTESGRRALEDTTNA